jgi:alpha-beta hydrolase superfamily lysophospholipase
MPSLIGWVEMHPALTTGVCLLALFLVLNVLAFRHAHAMTHFAPAPGPDDILLLEGVGVGPDRGPPGVGDTPAWPGLDSEVHRFAGAADELEAWYVPHPSARGLVLMFHGYKTGKAVLLPEARAFHELGYSCFLVDFPGSGGSPGRATTIGYREADEVARSAAYAAERWGGLPLVLYGQSMGSAAVLRALAVHGVRADAAVLECPFDRLLRAVGARIRELGVPAFPYAHLLVFWGGKQLAFNGFLHNPVEYARRVRCPVLLLHGRSDPLVTCEHVEAIYRNLGGQKQLHSFPGVGHESSVARRPQEWKEQVGPFLLAHERSPVRP